MNVSESEVLWHGITFRNGLALRLGYAFPKMSRGREFADMD
jgi:hypothetical protein